MSKDYDITQDLSILKGGFKVDLSEALSLTSRPSVGQTLTEWGCGLRWDKFLKWFTFRLKFFYIFHQNQNLSNFIIF